MQVQGSVPIISPTSEKKNIRFPFLKFLQQKWNAFMKLMRSNQKRNTEILVDAFSMSIVMVQLLPIISKILIACNMRAVFSLKDMLPTAISISR